MQHSGFKSIWNDFAHQSHFSESYLFFLSFFFIRTGKRWIFPIFEILETSWVKKIVENLRNSNSSKMAAAPSSRKELFAENTQNFLTCRKKTSLLTAFDLKMQLLSTWWYRETLFGYVLDSSLHNYLLASFWLLPGSCLTFPH